MEITEIRVKLMEESEDRLRAFCSITIDGCFVVRDLKIIEGTSGPFVAMPSRKLAGHCQRCSHKNHLRANYCNHCGAKLEMETSGNLDSPQKLYADVAHPINSECREMIQNAVLEEFESEVQRSSQPGYRSRYDDHFDDSDDPESESDNRHSATSTSASSVESGPSAGPPRPHFDEPTPPTASSSVQREDERRGDRDARNARGRSDDSFGAGIFE